jgi:hypothetical protein
VKAWGFAIGVALSACRPHTAQLPCAGAGTCGSTASCLVGRCRPADAQLVAPEARRITLAPTEVAVLCAGRPASAPQGAPQLIGFDLPSCRNATLLLRFQLPAELETRVAGAFLVLDAVPHLAPVAPGLALEVAPILEPWSARSAQLQPPPVGFRVARGVVTAGAGIGPALRIDLTALVSSWSRRTLEDNGLALSAASGARSGIALATAADTNQSGPRLDVYLR